MTTLPTINEGESLSVEVQVWNPTEPRTAKDITGGTITLYAVQGRKRIAGTASADTPTNVRISGLFAPGALTAGVWNVICRVTLSGETRDVLKGTTLVRPTVT